MNCSELLYELGFAVRWPFFFRLIIWLEISLFLQGYCSTTILLATPPVFGRTAARDVLRQRKAASFGPLSRIASCISAVAQGMRFVLAFLVNRSRSLHSFPIFYSVLHGEPYS